MSSLVDKLCSGEHPVELSLRPERNGQALQNAIDRNYIHVRFTATQGGTELGFRLDRTLSRLESADAVNQKGRAIFVGELTLDYVKVRCVAEIDLTTFLGTGHLERLPI